MKIDKILSNRYEIVHHIGVGGMSNVYKAFDTKTKKTVAVKILKEELCNEVDVVKRFRSEASATINIKHKNVVSAIDVVDEGKLHYIVMEFISGTTLDRYIKKRGKLSNEEVIDISMQIAKGVDAAHKVGIIHRDIKPQNIVIEKGIAKITDFGIARAITSTTKNISIVGTVHYISPEQVKNVNVDFRSDIYSLGCTMYEMITGITPFQGEEPTSILISHIRENLKLPSIDNQEIYKSLEKIILKATKINPNERYQNMRELIKDLEKASFDKTGSYIEDYVYSNSFGDTVIVSETDMKVLKMFSEKYSLNDDNFNLPEKDIPKDFKHRKKKPSKNYLVMIIISILFLSILVLIFLFISNNKKVNEIKEDENISNTVQDTITSSEIIYTNLMKTLPGINIEIAKNLCKDYGIYLIVENEEFDDIVDEDEIISVRDANYKEGDRVYVTISKGKLLLDFSNKEDLNQTNIQDFEKKLIARDLSYEIVESFDNRIPYGFIIGVNKKLSSDDGKLIITVSKGISSEMILMPNLYNRTIDEALSIITTKGLIMGDISLKRDDKVPVNCILEQSIEKDTAVAIGTAIDVTVSSGLYGETKVATKKKMWVSNIDESYVVNIINSPLVYGDINEKKIIQIRLKQDTIQGTKYYELSKPEEYQIGTTMPIAFNRLIGEENINTGYVEVVDVVNDYVLKSFEVSFSVEN